MSYTKNIIKALEGLILRNVETQTDLIVRMMAGVPTGEHEAVLHACAVYCVLSNRLANMKIVSWGDEAVYQAEAKDNRFVAMPVGEWEHTKVLAKRCAWFSSWAEWKEWADRINSKRRIAAPAREIIAREPDIVAMLLEDRHDIIRNPVMHVHDEAEKFTLIRQIEMAIVARGGKARLDKVVAAEWAACN
jgi:hypothetical protein